MDDFYFAFDFNEKMNTASRICRHIDNHFEQYNKNNHLWEVNNELSCIFIGEDIYYDEITEEQAMKFINA